MGENEKEVAKNILETVGGKKNLYGAKYCVTRLRLFIKDDTLFTEKELTEIEGVTGVMRFDDQFQIILKPGLAVKVGKAFGDLIGEELEQVPVNRKR